MKLQDYTPAEVIEGVKIVTPKLYKDDGGEFSEILRGDTPANYSGEAAMSLSSGGEDLLQLCEFDNDQLQVNLSLIHPGVIKGFHLHLKQTDIWYAPQKILVNLIDMRTLPLDQPEEVDRFLWAEDGMYNRATLKKMRLVLDKQLLVIPPGIAHGLSNPYTEDRTLIYFVNRFFDPKDEWRLPWNLLSAKDWELAKG